MDACEHLGIDVPTLNGAWVAAQNAKKLVKLGGGFYCGLIEMEGKDPIYVSFPQPPGTMLQGQEAAHHRRCRRRQLLLLFA